MTTTTITGTDRRSSSRQPDLQVSAKATTTATASPAPPPPITTTTISSTSESMTSPVDKFPAYNEELYSSSAQPEEGHLSPTHHKFQPNTNWEGRNIGTSSWEHANGSIRVPRTRSRRSVSEAFSHLRKRDASVSANAHELAQALKAPLSYRLVVSYSSKSFSLVVYYVHVTNPILFSSSKCLDPLCCLVHNLCPHKHFIQVYPKYSASTRHPYHCTVCFCVNMVFALILYRQSLSFSKKKYSCP